MKRISDLLHSLKNHLESFASRPYALWVLFLVAFIESSIFPVPPDVLFLALAVANPRGSFRYAAVCVAGSVAGAMLGYVIGAFLFESIGEHVVAMLGMTGRFNAVLGTYRENAWTTLLVAGFTNIPFCIFTLAAGFNHTLDLPTLFFGALVGRTVRFFLLGLLLYFFGPAVSRFLDRYIVIVTIVVLLLMVVTFLFLRG